MTNTAQKDARARNTRIPRIKRAYHWTSAAWEMDAGEYAFRITISGGELTIDQLRSVGSLIEAAPKMLATLEKIDADLSKIKGASDVRRPIRAAIAKARGES